MGTQTNTAAPSPIQAAWERRQTAYAAYSALPFSNLPVIDGHGPGEKALEDEMSAAEEVLRAEVGQSLADVKAQLWCGLYHAFPMDVDHQTITRGDFARLAEDEKLSWSEALTISALQSINAIEAKRAAASDEFDRLHDAFCNLKEAESALGHDATDEAVTQATDRTDEAYKALIGYHTINPGHLAAKLAAALDHYRLIAHMDLDGTSTEMLFTDIVAMLKQQGVR